MQKIAVIGTHGVGKSTLCYKLASHYKKLGANVDLVQEIARKCPFPINEGMSPQASLWIYHTQIQRELEAEARGFDTIICDRSPFDTFVYAEYFKLDKQDNFQLNVGKRAALNWLETYNQLIFVRPNFPIKPDGTRSTDIDFQDGINNIFLDYFDKYISMDFKDINSSEIFKPDFQIEDLL